MSRKIVISAGDKYEKWTAIKFDEIDEGRNTRWIFKCNCGTENSLKVSDVVKGRTKSCRHCKNSKDLTGKQFGNWKVIEKLPKLPHYSHNRWLCECKCGNKVDVDQSNLVNGGTKQCNKCRIKIKVDNKTPIPNKFWAKCMYNAGERKIDWNLKEEDAWNTWLKQDGKCRFTGLLLSFDGENKASLDRIDSDIGYVEDNIQWVYKKINFMKSILDDNEFIQLCKLVSNNCIGTM